MAIIKNKWETKYIYIYIYAIKKRQGEMKKLLDILKWDLFKMVNFSKFIYLKKGS